MNILNSILDNYPEVEFLKADGFDDAVIGFENISERLIYSVSKCLDILNKDMSEEDAIDYFYFNVSGAYVGEKTPIWCEDDF